jgi:hypothetical protein
VGTPFTITITVEAPPVISSVVATPSSICTGSSSNLVASVSGSTPTTIVNYNFNVNSFATLTPVLAKNITSTVTSSTAFASDNNVLHPAQTHLPIMQLQAMPLQLHQAIIGSTLGGSALQPIKHSKFIIRPIEIAVVTIP